MKLTLAIPRPCPQCSKLPTMSIDDSEVFELSCAQHGHMALGDTLATAVDHWNHYIDFVAQESL